MPVLDTGLLFNRELRRTTFLTLTVMNMGRQPAVVGIQVYTMNKEILSCQDQGQIMDTGHSSPQHGEYGSLHMETLKLFHLQPLGTSESVFTINHSIQSFETYGVRIVTNGLGAGDVSLSMVELDENMERIGERRLSAEGATFVDELMLAYVANHTQHTLSVIQTSTLTRVATIMLPDGSSPRLVAITPDGSLVYVTCQGDKTVRVIDTRTQEICAEITLPIGAVPFAAAVSPLGNKVYVTTLIEDYVIVIDTSTQAITKMISIPKGADCSSIAFSPDGSQAYLCHINYGSIAIVDTATDTIKQTIKLPGGSQPSAIAIMPSGAFAYVTDIHYEKVYVIRLSSASIIAAIKLDERSDPQNLVITPDGALVYIASRGGDEIVVVNTSRNEILTTIELPEGSNVSDIAVSADGAKVYVTVLTFGYLAVIDIQSQLPVAILPTGSFPSGIAITPILLH